MVVADELKMRKNCIDNIRPYTTKNGCKIGKYNIDNIRPLFPKRGENNRTIEREKTSMDKSLLSEYKKKNKNGLLREYVNKNLTPSEKAGKNRFVCPCCGSGSGENGTGAFCLNGEWWFCHRCGRHGDIANLIAEVENVPIGEAMRRVVVGDFSFVLQEKQEPKPTSDRREDTPTFNRYSRKDLKAFADAMQSGENDGKKYLHSRGFTDETIKRWFIGFDGKNVVVPYLDGTGFYFLRGIRSSFKGKPRNMGDKIFNAKAIESEKQIFVVEGQFDALAIIQNNGVAVALGSTNNTKLLLHEIEVRGATPHLLLALDNDEAGQTATQQFVVDLDEHKIKYTVVNVSGTYKDPAERLQNDPNGLCDAIRRATTTF